MTNILDIMDRDDLTIALGNGLVASRNHPTADLTIWNYTQKAMYTTGAWDNDAVRKCRGLITDGNHDIVARPWDKFFNYGDSKAPQLSLDTRGIATDKIDGSLGIIFLNPDTREFEVATRGSFESDQAKHATEILPRFINPDVLREWRWEGHTPTLLVEIIYPANRIVCDYGDRDELVLIGARCSCGAAINPYDRNPAWIGPVTAIMPASTLGEALALPPRPGAEGIVFMTHVGDMVKIKQEDYLRLHKAIFGLTERSVWEHIMGGGTLEELLDPLPDELHSMASEYYYNVIYATDDIVLGASEEFRKLRHIALRKDFAMEALQSEYAPFLFMMFDGRDWGDIFNAALKTVKPKG